MHKTSLRVYIIEIIDSLEKACEEYSKLVTTTNNVQQAKVTMASMLDRVKHEIARLKNLITIA